MLVPVLSPVLHVTWFFCSLPLLSCLVAITIVQKTTVYLRGSRTQLCYPAVLTPITVISPWTTPVIHYTPCIRILLSVTTEIHKSIGLNFHKLHIKYTVKRLHSITKRHQKYRSLSIDFVC